MVFSFDPGRKWKSHLWIHAKTYGIIYVCDWRWTTLKLPEGDGSATLHGFGCSAARNVFSCLPIGSGGYLPLEITFKKNNDKNILTTYWLTAGFYLQYVLQPYESKQLCPTYFSGIFAARKWLVDFHIIPTAAVSRLRIHSICWGEQTQKQHCCLSWSKVSWYLQVCVWGWLVQTGKIQVGLSSSLYAFWALMMNRVRSPESGLDRAFPLWPEHARFFLHGVDCAWTPETHWQLLN